MSRPTSKSLAFAEELGIDPQGLDARDLSHAIDQGRINKADLTKGMQTLSNDDLKRVMRAPSARLDSIDRTKKMLGSAGVVPGSVVQHLEYGGPLRIFCELSSATKGYLGHALADGGPCINAISILHSHPYDGAPVLSLHLIEQPHPDFWHRTFVIHKMRGQAKRHLDMKGPPSDFPAKVDRFFKTRLAPSDIEVHAHGRYWRESVVLTHADAFVASLLG